MEMGAGEDKLFDSKRSPVLDLGQLFAGSADGFAIFSGDVQELEAVVSVVEVAELRKHAHRRLASWHDELQPHPFFRDEWRSQRCAETAESDINSRSGEFHLLEAAEVLNTNFNREREAGKRAEILTTLLSEGRHEELGLSQAEGGSKKPLRQGLCVGNRIKRLITKVLRIQRDKSSFPQGNGL
jgi:hypothetical protein